MKTKALSETIIKKPELNSKTRLTPRMLGMFNSVSRKKI